MNAFLRKELRLLQPTVSHHLALLRLNGLVTNSRRGKQVYYSVDRTRLDQAMEAFGALLGRN